MSDIEIEDEDQGFAFEINSDSSEADEVIIQNKNKKSKKGFQKVNTKFNVNKNQNERSIPYQRKPMQAKSLHDDTFQVFSNPEKRLPDEENSDVGDDDAFPLDDEDIPPEDTEEYHEQDLEEIPSPGFSNVIDEKNDLLYKFYRIQSKGVPLTKKFNINSSVVEMRNEFNKLKRDQEVNASIKFSRRMLMASVTGLEFLNKRYDPFDIKLDGWSENVMEGIDDYDNVFERLHDKYSSKTAMAPEIELLLTLSGSAFMFHLTNSMFKSIPNMNDIAKQNPDFIKNMMKTVSQMANNQNGNSSNQIPTTQNESFESNDIPVEIQNGNSTRREMQAPMFDLSQLSPMMNVNAIPPPISSKMMQTPIKELPKNETIELPIAPQSIDVDEALSILSDDASSKPDSSVRNISFSDLPPKPKRKYTKRNRK